MKRKTKLRLEEDWLRREDRFVKVRCEGQVCVSCRCYTRPVLGGVWVLTDPPPNPTVCPAHPSMPCSYPALPSITLLPCLKLSWLSPLSIIIFLSVPYLCSQVLSLSIFSFLHSHFWSSTSILTLIPFSLFIFCLLPSSSRFSRLPILFSFSPFSFFTFYIIFTFIPCSLFIFFSILASPPFLPRCFHLQTLSLCSYAH